MNSTLGDDDDDDFETRDIFDFGLYYVYSMMKYPVSFGTGFRFNDNAVLSGDPEESGIGWQFVAFASIDVPLFSFYMK